MAVSNLIYNETAFKSLNECKTTQKDFFFKFALLFSVIQILNKKLEHHQKRMLIKSYDPLVVQIQKEK